MRSPSPSNAIRSVRPRSGQEFSELEELGRRFALFRREHRRGAMIPEDLKAAAVAAFDQGATPGQLQRTCGVSWGQIVTWKARLERRRRRPRPAKARSAEPTDVRVFSVVDETSVHPTAVSSAATEQELELRLGPWTVSVRLAGPVPAGRG